MKLTDQLRDNIVFGFLDPDGKWIYFKTIDIGDYFVLATLVDNEWIPSFDSIFPKKHCTIGGIVSAFHADQILLSYRIIEYDYAK